MGGTPVNMIPKRYDNCRMNDISFASCLVIWALRRCLREPDAREMMSRTFAHAFGADRLGQAMATFEQMISALRRGARAPLDVRAVEDDMVSNHEATVLAILAAFQWDNAGQASWLVDTLVHRCERRPFASAAYGFAGALAAAGHRLPPDGRRALRSADAVPPLPAEQAQPHAGDFSFLSAGEQTIVTGIRLWVHVLKRKGDPLAALRTHFAFHCIPDAAMSLNAILDHSRMSATRSIDVRCPKCPGLSPDEARMLHAVALLQRDDRAAASAELSSWLPPAVVRLTLFAVDGLARAMTVAHTRLPLRNWRFEDNAMPADGSASASSADMPATPTLH